MSGRVGLICDTRLRVCSFLLEPEQRVEWSEVAGTD